MVGGAFGQLWREQDWQTKVLAVQITSLLWSCAVYARGMWSPRCGVS